jgi:hypothetical protein
VLIAALLATTMAAPVLAAPPDNDTYTGRIPIAGLPFSDTVDTSEATTDADDTGWNATCGAPATDASIWYEFSTPDEIGVIVDSAGSDYTVGIAAVVGTPGDFDTVACGPDAIGFLAAAGETYLIVVFDDQEDGGNNGGTLELNVEEAPPPPTVDVTVDPVGRFDSRTGSATVSGTVTCTGDALDSFLDVQLEQRVGRLLIRGFGGTGFVCDGVTHDWAIEVIGDNGLFKGGKAASLTFAVACNFFTCGFDEEAVTIQLKR